MAIYIAFDVETPNRANDRMSAIGISAIKDNRIVANYYSLVNPETHFDYFNTQLTGIDAEKVKSAPNFAELWEKIEPIMSKGILVAHNAVFDMSVLRQCLRSYGISWKAAADYLCTVQIGRRVLPNMKHNLDVMCEYYDIALNHHQADSDSRACAEILLRYMESGVDVSQYLRQYWL
ncbi:MAG: 3'-5' exonuclease [Ruminococcus sp.]|uniref:3'-5' exonuclease n=1 Tax=Ruminococcus sp. TaxID=41978 RepID=UPI0025D37745|nr:3'-5' exonuclease [Ruminococcus sp.]MCR5599239.1 3'-5' exonuclease [Ruminococcus sp.]